MITTMDAFFLTGSFPRMKFKNRIHITGEDTVDLTKLEQDLTALGYGRESQIEAGSVWRSEGELSMFFLLRKEMPVRIELWGDEIDSIRMFDAKSQRSIEKYFGDLTIYPASENCFGNNGLGILFEIFSGK